MWPDWTPFWKILTTIFLTKEAQIFNNFWGFIKNVSWREKTALATYWATFSVKLGHCLFQYLVTLNVYFKVKLFLKRANLKNKYKNRITILLWDNALDWKLLSSPLMIPVWPLLKTFGDFSLVTLVMMPNPSSSSVG